MDRIRAVEWFHLAEDSDGIQVVVNTIINFRFQKIY
jgi:hypothetical protein